MTLVLTLSEEERELLHTEAAQAAAQVRHPETQRRYAALAAAALAGEVPDELLEPLEGLLEVGLESGRIRQVHTAHGEMTAAAIFSRTPRGRALTASIAAVNDALRALAGHTLQEVRLAAAGPGAYSLTLATGAGTLLVRLGRHGVRVHSVEVG